MQKDTRVGKNIVCTSSKEFLNKHGIDIQKHVRIMDIFAENNDNGVVTIHHKNILNIYIENNIYNIKVFSGIKEITHIKILNCDQLDIVLEKDDNYYSIYIKYKRYDFVFDDNIINNTWR